MSNICLKQDQWETFNLGEQKSYIYSLFKNDRIIYIGQTISLDTRIICHEKDKDFDLVKFFRVPRKEANEWEAEMILRHNPIYNCTIPKNTRICTLNHFIYKYANAQIRKVKIFVSENNIKDIRGYYFISDLMPFLGEV